MLETQTLSTAHIFIFIMITWTAILIFCSALSPSLCCDWLRQYGHYSNISLTLLHHMGGQLTDHESPVCFPYKLYKDIRNTEVMSQVIFVRDSLKQIDKLYHHVNLSSVTWDTDKTDHFRMSLRRLIDGLNSCAPKHPSQSQNLNQLKQHTRNSLRRYYRRLRIRLDCTGGDTTFWELIRKDTERHLEQLDLLVNSLRSSAASSRSSNPSVDTDLRLSVGNQH